MEGLDTELSVELARDLGVQQDSVESSFTTPVADLNAPRCDMGMFAIAIVPQRLQQLAFTRPDLLSDLHAVTTKTSAVVRRWEDIHRPGVAVAVQAGIFMEPVMAAVLKMASLVGGAPPASLERELEAARVDVFMTDCPYSRRLLDNADRACLVNPPAPFHVLTCACAYDHAVKQGDPQRLAQVDSFVQRIQRDGRLLTAARRHRPSDIVHLR